jgi:hypothetical protein
MKHLRTACLLSLLLAFLPLLSFGAEQHKTITIDQKAMIGNQQLKPGRYTLRFDDSKDMTNVDFQQYGKTIATQSAKIVHQSSPNNATYELNTASGKNELDRVYLPNEQLVFGNNSQASSATTSKTTTPPTS